VVWGGVALGRSLLRLDLIDEWNISLYPYLTGQGTLLFDDATPSHPLDLVASRTKSSGLLELRHRRRR
jgi:dihydrofolate reductase